MIHLGSCICTVEGLAMRRNRARVLPEPLHLFAGDARDHACRGLCLTIHIPVSHTSCWEGFLPLQSLMYCIMVCLFMLRSLFLHFNIAFRRIISKNLRWLKYQSSCISCMADNWAVGSTNLKAHIYLNYQSSSSSSFFASYCDVGKSRRCVQRSFEQSVDSAETRLIRCQSSNKTSAIY